MQEAVQQSDNAGGVGKDLVPLFEGTVGGDNHRLAFVAAVDDLVEQIGGFVVEGQVADLVNAQQAGVGVSVKLAAAPFQGLALEFFQQRGGGTKQYRGVCSVVRGESVLKEAVWNPSNEGWGTLNTHSLGNC